MPRPRRDVNHETNLDFWENAADSYQAEHARDLAGFWWGPAAPREEDIVAFGDVAGLDVVDLGCGGGQGARWLAAHGAKTVVGVDYSDAQLAHAQKDAPANVRFVQADIRELCALPDACADLVVSVYCLGYIEDVERVLAEAARILRPGGRLVFSWSSPIFDRTSWDGDDVVVSKSFHDRAPFKETDLDGTTVEFCRTHGDWVALLSAAGFNVTGILEPPAASETSFDGSHMPEKLAMVPGTTIWQATRRT